MSDSGVESGKSGKSVKSRKSANCKLQTAGKSLLDDPNGKRILCLFVE